jgi:membrane AbrB-like protein
VVARGRRVDPRKLVVPLSRSALLTIMALLFVFGLQSAHLPAAWLFGPLVASALFAVRDWQAVEWPRPVYIAAQAVIGTALGGGFSPATLLTLTLPKHFSIFAFAVVFILLTSLFKGWLLTRRARLDVATAFLGTMPGGAGEMAAMSDSLRADSRLVVVMQYTRLLLILTSLALITPILSYHFPSSRVQEAPVSLLATFVWWKIGVLCLLAFFGWLTGMRTRIPAGTFLVPTVLYFLLRLGVDSDPRNGPRSDQRLFGRYTRWARLGGSGRSRIARRYCRRPLGPPGAAPVCADRRPVAGSRLLEMAGWIGLGLNSDRLRPLLSPC